LGNILHNLL